MRHALSAIVSFVIIGFSITAIFHIAREPFFGARPVAFETFQKSDANNGITSSDSDKSEPSGFALNEPQASPSLDDVLLQLRRSDLSENAFQNSLSTFIEVIGSDPTQLERVTDDIGKYRTNKKFVQAAIKGIAATQWPEAQKTLRELAENSINDRLIFEAVLESYGTAHAPASENLEQLISFRSKPALRDVRTKIMIAIGNVAFMTEDDKIRERALDVVRDVYTNAKTTDEKTEALAAIGASGDESFLPLLRGLALSPTDPVLAAYAISAMRQMPEAEDDLTSIATGKNSADLKIAALNAMKDRLLNPQTLHTLLENYSAFDKEANGTKIRMAALDILSETRYWHDGQVMAFLGQLKDGLNVDPEEKQKIAGVLAAAESRKSKTSKDDKISGQSTRSKL